MYKHHSIALNQKDQAVYEKVNKATGLAVTAIFRKMLYSLEKVVDTSTDESIGDGKNKSAIILNVPTEQPSEPTEKEMAIKQADAVGIIEEE